MDTIGISKMVGAEEYRLSGREFLVVAVAGLIFAVVAVVASLAWTNATLRYRAETMLALLPGANVPSQELASSWEALSRGQAPRIAAEVLRQRRWITLAAQSAGVPATSISVTAGTIADTSLITVGVEADSRHAAEQAADALVKDARPVVEQVSGPFALEIIQPADGGAMPTGTPLGQLLPVAGAVGLMIGSGGALMIRNWTSWRGLEPAGGESQDSSGEESIRSNGTSSPAGTTGQLPEAVRPVSSSVAPGAPETARHARE